MPDSERNQAISGIGDARHTGIGHQRDASAALKIEHQFRRSGHFIVFVITGRSSGDAVVVQQLLGLPSVFTGDHVSFLEHADGPQRDVLEVADGRCHQVKSRRQNTRRT